MNTLKLRKSLDNDFDFIREMLYEAVFWRESGTKPTFEEGLAYPDVAKAIKDWGKHDGDTAVIATVDSKPVGAAWFRYWSDSNTIRGYYDENVPVAVIGLHGDYRHQGIGKKMMQWLVDYAKNNSIDKISLAVTKDNYAINLYRQQGFKEHEDMGDWFIMVRDI